MLTVIVSLALVLLGLCLLIAGLGFFIVFRLGLRIFDQSLRSQIAAIGQQHVEQAAAKIPNKFVRQFVMQYLVQTGGTAAVSSVRGALQSRMRTGLYLAFFGGLVLVSAIFTRT